MFLISENFRVQNRNFPYIITLGNNYNEMNFKKTIINQINKLTYVRNLYKQTLNTAHPNGHFYSPVFSIEDIKKRQSEIWKNVENDGILGISLQTENQKKLISFFKEYCKEIPFKAEKQSNIRYHYDNTYYSYTDAIILYSMIRHFEPKKIIEIGCGFSSSVMLDTNELFFNHSIDLTFIDPNPERLYSQITDKGTINLKIIERHVQQVPLDTFEKLQAKDILFIDSTHVSKTGSDVNHILFEILPRLKRGVLIHFHDIFYPFEYPKDWVFRGFNWNENYILKAFLMYNDLYEIKLFPDYLQKHHNDCFKDLTLAFKKTGQNLWIEKK